MRHTKLNAGKLSMPKLALLLTAAFIITFLVSIMAGRYSISLQELIQLLGGAGRESGSKLRTADIVFFQSRLARVAAGAIIGAALSCAGASYQGIFHNPMVSPDILGAATGASFGAALAIYLGWDTVFVQLTAFCFGLVAVGADIFRKGYKLFIGQHNGDFVIAGKVDPIFQLDQLSDMKQQLVGIFVIHPLVDGDIIDLVVFQRGFVSLFFNHPANTLISHFTANIVFIISAENETAVTTVLII